jgi:hypothetical protein
LNFAEHEAQEDEKSKEAKPTITTKTHFHVAKGIVQAEIYNTQTVEGSPNSEVVIDGRTNKPEAEVKKYFGMFKVTKSASSISVGGDGASLGISEDKITFDVTLIKWGNSGWGFTFSFDSRLLLLPIVIYNPVPVLQMIGH